MEIKKFNSNKILIAKNIKRTFTLDKNIRLEVLKGISLEIYEGEILVIVGASGAGKSTLLHILGTIDKPDEGEIEVDNINVMTLEDEEISKFRNQKFGFIFQFHHLLPEFTAIENLIIPMLIKGINVEESKARAKELLDLVQLSDRMNHKPSELSGGEQQRVAVARALVNQPRIVFADEPSGNLDTKNSEMLHQLIKDLNQNFKQTFVIVTHNPELVKIAHRVLEIRDGKIFE